MFVCADELGLTQQKSLLDSFCVAKRVQPAKAKSYIRKVRRLRAYVLYACRLVPPLRNKSTVCLCLCSPCQQALKKSNLCLSVSPCQASSSSRTVVTRRSGRLQGQAPEYFEIEVDDDGRVCTSYSGELVDLMGTRPGTPAPHPSML